MGVTADETSAARQAHYRVFFMLLGLGCCGLVLLLPAPENMSLPAWRVTAVMVLMAVWWVSEAVPAAVTALVPIALMPLLDIRAVGAAAAPYANPLIFLLFGGFLLGLAMQRCSLHRRIALGILRLAGRRPDLIVAGFMAATAFLSMWISNTATAAMMLPIGLSVIALVGGGKEELPSEGPQRNLAICLLLGIACAANIGGMGTLIGTPPNALLSGFMAQTYDIHVGFAQWMLVGVPVAAILLVVAWLVLTRLLHPVDGVDMTGLQMLLGRERVAMGPMSRAEKRVLAVCVAAALGWLLRPLLEQLIPGTNLSDAGIAMLAGILLFLIPSDLARNRFLLDWSTVRATPWNVLLLVGGGLSLGAAIEDSGLAAWVGDSLSGLAASPVLFALITVSLVAMLASHVTSNTATAAALVPMVTALALTIGQPPMLLAVPTVLAASCAFMLPVATPPNSIVYGSGLISVAWMLRAGALLSLVAMVVIVTIGLIWAPVVFS